ncbi:unnamed protein product [Discosporangium mesarthrocarpum]
MGRAKEGTASPRSHMRSWSTIPCVFWGQLFRQKERKTTVCYDFSSDQGPAWPCRQEVCGVGVQAVQCRRERHEWRAVPHRRRWLPQVGVPLSSLPGQPHSRPVEMEQALG